MKANIDKFRNLHNGARIAVLGSSPTIRYYESKEDISIAVNGSVNCEPVKRADYFMCGDKESHKRRWFDVSRSSCNHRILATFVAPYDFEVLPDLSERSRLVKEIESDEAHLLNAGANIRFSPDFRKVSEDHGIFEYADIWEQEISKGQERLCRGGTISGVAAQMALVMGASEIHLYGCSFGNENGDHYGYDPGKEPGNISKTHPVTMDYILSRIMANGVKVFSHGFTNLRTPISFNQSFL